MKKLAYVMLGILLMASCGKQSIPTEYSEENRTARIATRTQPIQESDNL